MKFEIRKKDNNITKVFFCTEDKKLIPDNSTVASMEAAGYTAYLDNKRYKPQK